MKQIQEWLGHSDISTTANICAHFLVSPHVLDSYRPAQKMAALAKEFSQQGKPTEKSSA